MNSEKLLHRIEWTVLRRLDGLLQGDYRTLYRGFGVDLADLREYQYHDDVRHIDWNVTARLEVPYVRQFVEDRDVTAWFLIDLTESMRFGSGLQTKSEAMIDYIALISRVMTKHGNRVGALVYRGGDSVAQVLPAATGRKQVLQLLHMLGERKDTKTTSETDLGAFFGRAGAILKRRSVLFIASDFISKPHWQVPLGILAKRHEVVALRSQDALEAQLPDLGLITLQDSETGEQLLVDTHNKLFRQRFASIATARQKQIEDQLAKAGVDSLMIGPVEDLVAFAIRRRRLPKLPRRAFAP
jgi:uncharacterized protein (DUF58 family)